MTQQAEAFVQSLMDGPSLRSDFQRAPRETAQGAGLDLSDADLRALQSVDWGDDKLVARLRTRGVLGECAPSDVNVKENAVAVEHSFVQRLMDGPALRADFQRAPRETAQGAGLELSDTDLRALQSVDWGDDGLVARLRCRGTIGECGPIDISDVNAKANIVPVAWDR
jgi:hypothetical protein